MARPFDIVLTDVDGTLLRPSHALAARTRDAVRACVAGGVPFGIVTGRMPSGLAGIASELGVPLARVCYSGAYVLGAGGEEVASHAIPASRAAEVLELARELWPALQPSYFVGAHWYAADPCAPMVAREAAIVRATPERHDPLALARAGIGPNKLFFTCADVRERSFEIARVLSQRFADLDVIRSNSGAFVEVVPAGVDKAVGARALLDHLGLSLDRVLYFGDDANDVPLLRTAGHGVAMANAERSVRACADDVAASNAEDGLAAYLEEHVLPFL